MSHAARWLALAIAPAMFLSTIDAQADEKPARLTVTVSVEGTESVVGTGSDHTSDKFREGYTLVNYLQSDSEPQKSNAKDPARAQNTEANTASLPPGVDPNGAMKGSQFLERVWSKFYNSNGKSNWPGFPADTFNARAKAELPAALDALFKRAKFGIELPPADANTALGKLKAAAGEVDWPNTSKIPDEWPEEDDEAYRLYEVACTVNIMIRAIYDSGGGGGPRTFPPPSSP